MNTRLVVAGLALALLAVGCSSDVAPDVVSEQFWTAVQTRDLETAEGLSINAKPARLEGLANLRTIESVSIGKSLRDESVAMVETTLTFEDADVVVTFNTNLERGDDGWRVDVTKTASEMRRATLMASLQQAEEALRGSAEVVQEALEQGRVGASEAVREALEDLEQALEAPGDTPPDDDLFEQDSYEERL